MNHLQATMEERGVWEMRRQAALEEVQPQRPLHPRPSFVPPPQQLQPARLPPFPRQLSVGMSLRPPTLKMPLSSVTYSSVQPASVVL
jgi:hypothetical protein